MMHHLQFCCGIFLCHAFNDEAEVSIRAFYAVLASKFHSGLDSSQRDAQTEPTNSSDRSIHLQQFSCSQAAGWLKT